MRLSPRLPSLVSLRLPRPPAAPAPCRALAALALAAGLSLLPACAPSGGGDNPEATIDAPATPGADIGGATYVKSYSVDGAELKLIDSAATADGGQYILARNTPAGAAPAIALLRVNSTGDVMWARSYGEAGAPGTLTEAHQVSEAGNGAIWVSGTRNGVPRFVRLDADGEVTLTSDIDADDAVPNIAKLQALPDGGFVAAGTVPGLAREAQTPNGGDLWLLRADAGGRQVALAVADGEPRASEIASGLHVGPAGEVTVVGGQSESSGRPEFWVAHYRTDLSPAFEDTYTGFTLRGSARGVVQLGRQAGSNVSGAGIVVVGMSDGARGIVSGRDNFMRSRLVYLGLPDGEQHQDEDIEVGEVGDGSYLDVIAFRDPNTVLASGMRDQCPADADSCGGSNEIRDLVGILQVLQRVPEDLSNGNTFVVERQYDLADIVPGLAPDVGAREMHPVVGESILMLLSALRSDNTSAGKERVAMLDSRTVTLLWTRTPSDIPGLRDTELVTARPTRDRGVLLLGGNGVLVRLDSNGTVRWRRDLVARVPGVGEPTSVTALSQGGALVTTAGGVLRFSGDGSLLLARRLDGIVPAGAAEIDRDGDDRADGFVLLGALPGDTPRVLDQALLALRLDGMGEVIDAQQFSGGFAYSSQGPLQISRAGGRLLVPTSDGGLWLDAAGRATTRMLSNLRAADVLAAEDGAIFIENGASPSVTYFRMDGTPRWSRSFTPTRPVDVRGEESPVSQSLTLGALSRLPDGGVAVAGSVARVTDTRCSADAAQLASFDDSDTAVPCDEGLLLRLDPTGSLRWYRAYGGQREDEFKMAAGQADNGTLGVGTSLNFTYPRRSIFVTRTDADGEVGGSSCVAREPVPLRLEDAAESATRLRIRAVVGQPVTVTAEALPTTAVSNLTVTTARACSAAVASPLLTVEVQGGGRVTADSTEALRAGIDCPGDCSQRHASGVSVPLLAVPSAGQRFDGWAGDCAAFGNAPNIRVPLTRDATCSARFVATDTGSGGGSVALAVTVVEPTSTSGIATGNRVVSEAASLDCSAPRVGACSTRIASNAEVSLRALPGVGQRFVGWEGCDRVPQTPGDLCFVLGSSGDRAVRANFAPVPVANIAVVVTEPVGSTGNRITSFPAGIDCSSSNRTACSARFLGSTVDIALTATPEPGQRFVGWSGCNAVSTAASPQCFVQPGAGDRTVTAQFEAEPDSVELRVNFTGRAQLDDDGSAATDTVLSNLVGIRCVADGSGCVARFPQGMEVRLTLQLDPTLSASGRRSRLLGWTECDALEAVDIDIPPVCVLRMLNQDTEVNVQVGHVFDEAFTGNAPIARVAVTGARGALRPNAVDVEAMFDARGSSVEAGRRVIAYEWDWDANGVYDCAQTELDTGTCFTTGILSFGVASHQYTRRGATTARVRVIDDVGRARVVERTFAVE